MQESIFEPVIADVVNRIDLIIQERLSQAKGKTENAEDVLNYEGAAELLKKPVGTIRNWVSQKTIPHYRQTGGVYFLRSELLDWIKAGEVKTKEQRIKKAGDEYVGKK